MDPAPGGRKLAHRDKLVASPCELRNQQLRGLCALRIDAVHQYNVSVLHLTQNHLHRISAVPGLPLQRIGAYPISVKVLLHCPPVAP